ncbi:MAG: response regulator transcription factor [Lachnospiraceae bacterium]|nr:response regulator transcription factor [Lachnospiraceae bacterium]
MRILIAEDEIATAKALKLLLEKAKYSVDIVHNGTDAWDYIQAGSYEVIVLDIMMPGMSGLEVLSLIRKNRIATPVLLLTAKAEIEDRVTGLEAGADDYLPKPFATSELIARIKALGRRSESYQDSEKTVGNLVLDSNRYEMRVNGKSVNLTNKEFQLMELFVQHPGYVFSTEHLMDKIWGLDTESDIDVVWTHIGFVRKKLRSIDADVEIKTIRGAGYSLEVTDD